MTEKESTNETPTAKALAMLSVFASLGARAFNKTILDIEGNEVKGLYRGKRSLDELRRTIGLDLSDAERNQQSIAIRPLFETPMLIQLDDLDAKKAAHLKPYAFMVIRTSAGKDRTGNYQGWVAVKDAPAEQEAAKDFTRRLRKGSGADATASGSTRIAGSLNFKTKYAPEFPRVEITHTNPGNVTTCAALEQAGFVAPREEPRPPLPAYTRPVTPSGRPSRKKIPSYAICLKRAHKAHGDDRPDISRVDFTFARTAAEWGWEVPHIKGFLMQFSEKAKQEGEAYALRTATRAAASVERQPYREKSAPRPA